MCLQKWHKPVHRPAANSGFWSWCLSQSLRLVVCNQTSTFYNEAQNYCKSDTQSPIWPRPHAWTLRAPPIGIFDVLLLTRWRINWVFIQQRTLVATQQKLSLWSTKSLKGNETCYTSQMWWMQSLRGRVLVPKVQFPDREPRAAG